jgi:hypothetical protein
MSTLAMKHFDLLSFVKRSKELGVPEPLAEYQGRQLEEVIEVAVASSKEMVDAQKLATQQDLQKEQSTLALSIKQIELAIREVEARLELKIKDLDLKIKEVEARLEVKIEQSKNQMIMWMVSLFIASGLITHFFK